MRELPGYARLLQAYHEAFEAELREMVASLPIAAGDLVIDVACGDGAYSRWLAERVGTRGGVLAVDLSRPFLEKGRDALREGPDAHRIRFVAADIDQLPFPDGTFDLAWCAQSLYSLPDPVGALSRMYRAVRPGGVVAVLENDSLHQVLLPWPVEIELAVFHAERESFIAKTDSPWRYYVGRQLCRVFRAAGLVGCRQRTWATNRRAPLASRDRLFLENYLRDLRDRIRGHLDPQVLGEFERLIDPTSDAYLLGDPDLFVTCSDHIAYGMRPVG